HPKRRCRGLHGGELADAGDGRLTQHRHPFHARRELLEQLQPLGANTVLEHSKAGGAAARPRKVGDQARANGSTAAAKMMGTARLTCCSASTIGTDAAKTTSGARANNSAAPLRMRSGSKLLAPQR